LKLEVVVAGKVHHGVRVRRGVMIYVITYYNRLSIKK
jgi:hypothetical protein